jgi:hypothetical protein
VRRWSHKVAIVLTSCPACGGKSYLLTPSAAFGNCYCITSAGALSHAGAQTICSKLDALD